MMRVVVILVCLLGLADNVHAAVAVRATAGNIRCDGKVVTGEGVDTDVSLAPDGHTVAFVRYPNGNFEDGAAADTELWVADCATGTSRRLTESRASDDVKANLTGFAGPTFSLNGGFVYVMTEAWATSSAIHQVSIKDGTEKFVVDGNSLRVLRYGPYRGYLIVQQHKYYSGDQGGSYDPSFVVRPDGKVMFMVPGTDSEGEADLTAEWLKKKGWTAW